MARLKSSKLYGIRATALKAIEQWRRGQAVVLDAVSWKRCLAEFAIAYAIALSCTRKWNQIYKLSKNFW
ncbi:hypothetical protein H6G91_38775 [Nostoc muscorum FACHB-395]|nr:hypothetical protein [Desmonostoc muscorum FACHB-395]